VTHPAAYDPGRRRDWLNWYCHLGWRLLPIFEVTEDGSCACRQPSCLPRDRGKHPRIDAWPRNATADPSIVLAWNELWPACNWAWALDEHFVIDDDPRNGGFAPETMFPEWERTMGFELTPTLVAQTGGGGLHVVYRQPPLGRVRNGHLHLRGHRLNGIDVKGEGGYILVEPSNHASGGLYRFPAWLDPADPPVELLAMHTRSSVRSAREDDTGSDHFDWDRALEPGAIPPGEQHDTLISAACSCRARNQSTSQAMALLRLVVRAFENGNPADPWDEERHAREAWRWARERYDAGVETEQPLGWRPRVIEGGLSTNGSAPAREGDMVDPAPGDGGEGTPALPAAPEDGDDDDHPGRNTDRYNAEELIGQQAGRVLWTPAGGWWHWDGTRWVGDQTLELERRITVLADTLWLRASTHVDGEQLRTRARRLEGTAGQRACLDFARQLAAVPDDQLDASPLLLNCPNGTLDLESDVLRPHSPADGLTRVTGVPYLEGATSPLLDEYHETFMPDPAHREAMYRLLGACLPGGNADRLLLFFIGGTTSGKSQLGSGLERALGQHCGVGTPSIFRGNLGDAPRPDILHVLTCRLVLLEEAGQAWELHPDRIKAMTGGTPVPARKMRSDEFITRVPLFTPIIIANEMPHVHGADLATKRRMRVIPFVHTPPDEDPRKKTAFLGDERTMCALLAEVVAGYRRYRECGLAELPHEFELARAEAFDRLDDVGDYLTAMIEEGYLTYDPNRPVSQCVQVTPLHRSYVHWVRTHGDSRQQRERLGRKHFGERLRAMGWISDWSNGTRWVGYSLSDPAAYQP
jgi:putative DNA primase/helicase